MFLQFWAAKFKLLKSYAGLKFTESFLSPPCTIIIFGRIFINQFSKLLCLHNTFDKTFNHMSSNVKKSTFE